MAEEKRHIDPEKILEDAIQEIDLFTQAEASRLDVSETGRLMASKQSPLEKVMTLASSYIGPIFSESWRREQAKKLEVLKQAILNARDIIQSHSALIIKFKEGNDSQRKLADYALAAIQRYNTVVSKSHEDTAKHDVYNYERQRLLSDEEIKGRPIELPHTLSIKFDSHPDAHPAYKMFKEMSQTGSKTSVMICPTHKKRLQFMIDTFHMKANRMLHTHLNQQNAMADIVPVVKEAPLQIDEESNPDTIGMQKVLEVGPGFSLYVTGSFKKNGTDPKFLTMPILDSFRLSFQLTHSGFPYPSQHTGWALADKWVEAFPLRLDQVPLFQKTDQRKKRLAQHLLHDQSLIQKARRRAKLKRDVFDQNRDIFIPQFYRLQQELNDDFSSCDKKVIEAFKKELENAPSSFDLLSQTEQKIQNLFIQQPLKALEEEWLETQPTLLRKGTSHEKLHAACKKMEETRTLVSKDSHSPYLIQQGLFLGSAYQSIGLQYQSERMGFSPPLLSDFERRLQLCAFQQLLSFLDECENRIDVLDPHLIKEEMLIAWEKDIAILKGAVDDSALAIVDELEFYFNSRFYAYSRPSEKVV